MKKHIGVLAGLVYSSLLCSFAWGGVDPVDSVAILNLNKEVQQAEIVLLGSLKRTAAPYEEFDRDFFRIIPTEVLKGDLPSNGLMVVRLDLLSSEGPGPFIGTNDSTSFVLCLNKIELENKAAPKEIPYYQLVGNWKGIIALDQKTKEQRAAQNILKTYNVNVYDKAEDFKQALRVFLKPETIKPEAISPAVKALIETLSLKPAPAPEAEK